MEQESTINKSQAAKSAEELLKNGSVRLTAKTRQDIYDQASKLVDSLPKGTKLNRGICQYRPSTFDYEQTIKIIKQ